MKKNKNLARTNQLKTIIVLIYVFGLFTSCVKDDNSNPSPSITTSDISESIDENSSAGTILASIIATVENTNKALTYSITNQSPAGAISLNGDTLQIADASLFDYETYTEVTGKIDITTGEVTETIDFTITINDIQEAFITTWETTMDNEDIIIYTSTNTDITTPYNFTVDWGDGSISANRAGETSHIYTTAGIYTVSITGDFPAIRNTDATNATKLKTIESWGTITWETMSSAFSFCDNLTLNTTDAPNLSKVTNMTSMFIAATSFNGNISSWDVSTITNMDFMFEGATAFNQDISNWDVSNVTSMSAMFLNASAFSQDLSGWATDNVTSCNDFSTDSGLTVEQVPTAGSCVFRNK